MAKKKKNGKRLIIRQIHEKSKKHFKKILLIVLAIIFFVLLFFFILPASSVPEHVLLISSASVKQGDTVLLKTSAKYSVVTGSFDNKDIIFFRNNKNSDWSALLGIDADLKPGKYVISVNASGEKMEKEISVAEKYFPAIKMPITKQMVAKGYTGVKIVQNIKTNDNPAINQVLDKFTPQAYFSGPFGSPLANMQISGLGFGEFVKSAGYNIQHLGVDLRAQKDTEIHAINDGKVVLEKELSNYGKTVIVDHGLGIFSLYLHLDSFAVSENQQVKKGQVLGLSGDTGLATAPHLHFSIRDNGTRVDPLLFIAETQKTAQPGVLSVAGLLNRLYKPDFSW
jgi:murein DD-endopeptidase MepM/ murein hydrolase activator NlpD